MADQYRGEPGLCELLAAASHELRGPLQAIAGAAALLETDDPDQRRHVEVVRRSSERALRLVRELLDAALIGARRLSLRPEANDLRRLIEQGWDAVATAARARDVRLLVRVPDDATDAFADADRVIQVFTNLFDNAVRFTPEGGCVVVEAERTAEGLQISVVDEGRGVDDEDLRNVFDRFWQAPNAVRGAAGLGLAISKGIVSAHGGQIWARSVPGAGTAICFTLPAISKMSTLHPAG